ncbi:MAG: DUF3667 domain-containing protein, partial [Pseudoalteromonas sp.]
MSLENQLIKHNTPSSSHDQSTIIEKDEVPQQLTPSKKCDNCHQTVSGEFCSHCGQSLDSTLKYFWAVILHLLDDIFSFDSRASRTIWPLMFRPGFLTSEYFAGRRVHYVPPLRLYLFISIVFFLVLKLTVSAEEKPELDLNSNKVAINQVTKHIESLNEQKLTLDAEEKKQTLNQVNAELIRFNRYLEELSLDGTIEANAKLTASTRKLITLELERIKLNQQSSGLQNNKDSVNVSFDFLSNESNKKLGDFATSLTEKAKKTFTSDTNRLINEVLGKLPQLMFVLLPLFAVLLKIVFICSKRLYMEHLTIALHSHSFIFMSLLLIDIFDVTHDQLMLTGSGLAAAIASVLAFISFVMLLWIPVYLFIMQKRIYKQGIIAALITYGFVGIVYFVLMALTTVAAIIWGLTEI